METIKSFLINHDAHPEGVYLSHAEHNIYTYDLRFKKPNAGDFLTTAAAHTIEHLFATVIRNSAVKDKVVYFGPMGCRTGFYFLTRDSIPKEEVISLLRETFRFIAGFEGEIPGAAEAECGNFRDHDLAGAKAVAADYAAVLDGWTPERMAYRA